MSIKHYLILLSIFLFSSKSLFSQIVYANQGGTAQGIVSTMVGPGLTVTNPVISCPNVAYGTFSNGQTSNIGVNSGVVLSTGNISTLNGPANAANWSTPNGGNCNDPQLTSLETEATRDCCILEFDVVPSCSTLLIRFVFGSEEYPEYAPPNNSSFNDAFGFFVTGPNPSGPVYNNTNVATLPDNSTIVSINNINAITNNGFYVDNSAGTSIKLDAFTTVLIREIVVTPCETYHFKMAIADAGDASWDSAVFIDFLDCSTSLSATVATTPVSCAGNDGTATATGINGFPPYSFTWNTNPPQTTPSISGLAPGTYSVVVDDAGSCTPPTVQIFTVSTDINVPQVFITGDTCILDTTILTATPTIPGGTYLWSTGETTNTIQVAPSTISTYTCTYSVNDCPTTDSIQVTKKIVTTFNPISALCQGTTPINLPTSSSNQPNITGTWNSPTISTSVSGDMNYIFTPAATECATNDTLTITIKPTPTITVGPNQTICQGQQATINSTVSLPDGTYDWQPVDSTTANLTTIPEGTTTYELIYTLDGCPSLPATSTVTVNPNTPVYGGEDTLICIGESITLHAVGTPIIEWVAPVVDSVAFSPTETATYTVYGTGDNGCVTVDYITVIVIPTPIIDPGTPPTVCVGQQVTLNASGAGPNATYSWNFGVTNGVPFVANQNKTYTVTGMDQYGCVGQATINVTALPIPIADFTPSTTAGYVPLQVLFTNNSSYANNYVWDFGNGLDTVTINNGSTFTLYSIAPQDYVVYMIASNGYCSDTVSKIVKALLPPDISVPNVFSPNDDQSNDIFFVTSQNLASLELLIFNRWGNLMATINSPLGGWDGKTIGGNDATEGVYFYKYVATGQAGEEITGQGFLTLVR
jgi:gliding motility-associated-like protein